jgi:hypothetical protein
MLESTKDRVLGVDAPGQQVPPRVQYGMTCLLIRDAVGSVPCSDEWELVLLLAQGHTVQEGYGTTTTPGNLSNAMVL